MARECSFRPKMFVFGSAITHPETYERYAEPGIQLASEPDSEILPHASAGSLFRNYNLILDQVCARQDLDDVEAVVLLHQDAEIVDPDFCDKVRERLRDPDVALVGCAGAIGVRSIAWWGGSVTWASFLHRYQDLGGGDVPGLTWDPDDIPPFARTGEVDVIDGFVIAMSPWAVRELRFDESLGQLHGYDLDICLQARRAGRKVVTTDFRVIHHHSLDLIGDLEGWIAAHMRVAEKWNGSLPDVVGSDWRQRALRAEAEADAARLMQGLDQHLREVQGKELESMRKSASWRITAPLRSLGHRVRRRAS